MVPGTQQKEIKVYLKVANLQRVWVIIAENGDVKLLAKSDLCAEKLLFMLKNVLHVPTIVRIDRYGYYTTSVMRAGYRVLQHPLF